jgi:hypothetical protein
MRKSRASLRPQRMRMMHMIYSLGDLKNRVVYKRHSLPRLKPWQ